MAYARKCVGISMQHLTPDDYHKLLQSIPVCQRVTNKELAAQGITALDYNGATYVSGGSDAK